MTSCPPSAPTVAASPASPAPRSTGDMLFAMGSKTVYALSRVALPPLTLAYVGLAEYGLWATCFVIVSYLGMTASGFTLVYLRRTAQYHGAGDQAAINRLLSTGMFAMGGIGLLLLAGLWAALPLLLEAFNVAPEQRVLARQLWLGACAVFLADMSLGAFGTVLHAINRVRQEQTVWIGSFLLETAAIVALLVGGWGIHGLLGAFALRYVFASLANAWLVRRALPGLSLSPRHFDTSLLKQFFGVGALMQASGLIATALHSADKVISGTFIGSAATAIFDLATKLPITAASAPSSVSGIAVSAAARHDASGDHQALSRVYTDASRMTVVSLGLMLPFLALFADHVTLAWLGRGAVQAQVAPVMALLTAGLVWHMLTGPSSALFRGLGQLGAEFVYHGLRLSAFALAVGLWWRFGAARGELLALAIACAQTLAASTYLFWAHRRLTGSLAGLLGGVFAPMLGAFAIAAALRWAFGPAEAATRVQALAVVAGAGAAWVAAYTAFAWFAVLDTAQRARVTARVAQRLHIGTNWKRA